MPSKLATNLTPSATTPTCPLGTMGLSEKEIETLLRSYGEFLKAAALGYPILITFRTQDLLRSVWPPPV